MEDGVLEYGVMEDGVVEYGVLEGTLVKPITCNATRTG